ncbi:hypothetical protein NDA10_004835 [Ustilago hordei]|uniref:Related to PET127-component of mitochondrial translation system n=1 Tax=Ustilago hordei TaxID=120017 RepID=I2FXU3_USTHO|nr:related to PET127 - component of mitochondrial translation system [Ustilago hordei]KAJ1041214.1 hypothetical protein NDA10_004835 [Ustilago hordei]CCF51736.1 related to PET127-component of mitochondrial translation system [Ustilago hordei]SYW81705.1 related to PET127 - component of mitochondrial translation system [Ustilago hordei]
MNGRHAKKLALASLQLSKHRRFSTTSSAASLSDRLRKQWSGSSKQEAKAPLSSTNYIQRAGTWRPPPDPSTPEPARSSFSKPAASPTAQTNPSPNQRRVALRSLLRASTSAFRNESLKFVQSPEKGKEKGFPSTSADKGKAKAAAAHQASLLKELHDLDELLGSLQSQAFSISQRLKDLELTRKGSSSNQLEDIWGPDRLSPSAGSTTEDTGSAAPSSPTPHTNKQNVKRSDEARTRLVFGNDALAESNLGWRDGKGKPNPTISYSGPFAEEQKKWTESITGCVSANNIPIDKVAPLREMKVATLSHGLDRVLFNPGIYWLRDPRSGIYNFDPRIKDILDVDLFDYAALPPYITSSKDPELATLTKQHGKKYCGSTSSMTSLLSQCYFLISGWRNPDCSGFSAPFAGLPSGFSVGAKLPASILLHWKDGHYAIDADKAATGEAENSNYVLTSLGKSMEKMLTTTPEEYAKYMRINSWQLTEEEKRKPEAYHYASTGKMMMRSQLDCHDPRLPRKTFDLKTRASIGIRNDRANYVEGSGYQIRRATGVLESFEREYYDMIRAAFLKYNFQARIGHMDGIFVAYHTTSTIFGFQYISVEEMNERLFGSQEMADQAFRLSLGMMENVLDAATSMFPQETLKITIEAREKSETGMTVFVEPCNVPCTGDSGETKERSIVQLDITVDRYLNGGLMLGPVDFSFLPGRRVDPLSEDEIERRMRSSLPPVRWEIDYSISPRPDLTESKVRSNLDTVRGKQSSLTSLILPNVEALNAREQYRTEQLATNPDALQRFLEERASGVAAGMPLAPGQLSAKQVAKQKTLSHKTTQHQHLLNADNADNADKLLATLEQDQQNLAAPAPEQLARRKQVESRFIRMRNMRTLRLRELAKLGEKDAKDSLSLDERIMYSPRS